MDDSVCGAAGSGTERQWGARDARELEPGRAFDPNASLEAELGYGLGVPGTGAVITPYTELSLIEAGRSIWRTGTRWSLAPGVAMGPEATGQVGGGESSGEVRLRAALRF